MIIPVSLQEVYIDVSSWSVLIIEPAGGVLLGCHGNICLSRWIIVLKGRKSEDFVMSNDLNLTVADGGLGLSMFE